MVKKYLSAYLWIIDFSYASRLHHGGLLRYFNLSRELVASGHVVTFAVRIDGDKVASLDWLNSLRADKAFSDFCELEIDRSIPAWNRFAGLMLPFGLHGLTIRPFSSAVTSAISVCVARYRPDVVIVSSRSCLFVAYEYNGRPCIGDFSDSLSLYFWRQFRHYLAHRKLREVVAAGRDMLHVFFQELYSCRRYAANVVVSPIDKRVFDWIGDPRKNAFIANGVRIPQPIAAATKRNNQIVFSGAMDFPPNIEAALWFLDCVFPLVLREFPEATIVIAGAMPDPELLRRAGPNIQVPGFVPDLNSLIAESALYVAPLVTGSGFKNKIVESLANGTYVVGTTYAVEFLDPAVRALIAVRDGPAEMAQAICEFLANPGAYEDRLCHLRQIVATCFSWQAKAVELASLCDSISHPGTIVNAK